MPHNIHTKAFAPKLSKPLYAYQFRASIRDHAKYRLDDPLLWLELDILNGAERLRNTAYPFHAFEEHFELKLLQFAKRVYLCLESRQLQGLKF